MALSLHLEMEDHMTGAATALFNRTFTGVLPPGFAVSFSWGWNDDWAWGYCSTFTEMGASALALGPLMVHFEWDI